MGLIRSGFSFTLGTLFGIYLAQNYNIPNVQGIVNVGLVMAKQIERAYRKRGKDEEDDY
ncbi:hypothetical protein SELMODRAFT_124561 [Selaginella moellendorffii]|uniref:Uncharacterized protein n=1 Tax=Selaginella moellendorffii TaxID=88036 RepID=D8STN5_SELML|nr:hypothetical protein SELMODRAFT_124561 [Selaginella moellendorffii]